MTVVADASVVVAALTAAGPVGDWAADQLQTVVVAPALLPFECANALRRLESAGRLGADVAAQCLRDVQRFPWELWPFEAVADRVWRLRGSLTAYDASYVALAALLDAPLATLDARLVRGAATECRVLTC